MTEKEVANFIQGIIEKCSGERYIFRGENMKYPRPVSSSLYRHLCQSDDEEFVPRNALPVFFSAATIEKMRLKEARRHFSPGAKNIEILTELRHYGGHTALIDFSRNLHIALYFACEGEYKDDGYLYFYKESQFGAPLADIEYKDEDKEKDRLVIPTGKNARVVFQSSVFVHSYRGYLFLNGSEKERIPRDDRDDILNYLKKYFSIDDETIYNDIHGFIAKQDVYTAAEIEFHRGLANYYDNPSKAVFHYDKTIEMSPRSSRAYHHRGLAKLSAKNPLGAIADFNKAIELGPKTGDKYYYRGIAKIEANDRDGAIKDITLAIERYCERISALEASISYSKAMNNHVAVRAEQFTKGVQQVKLSEAYQNLGELRKAKGDEKGAKENFRKAEELRKKMEEERE